MLHALGDPSIALLQSLPQGVAESSTLISNCSWFSCFYPRSLGVKVDFWSPGCIHCWIQFQPLAMNSRFWEDSCTVALKKFSFSAVMLLELQDPFWIHIGITNCVFNQRVSSVVLRLRDSFSPFCCHQSCVTLRRGSSAGLLGDRCRSCWLSGGFQPSGLSPLLARLLINTLYSSHFDGVAWRFL